VNPIGSVMLVFGSSDSPNRTRSGVTGLFARLEGLSAALGSKRISTILCPASGYSSDVLMTSLSCTPGDFAEHLAARASAVIIVEWHHYCVEVARELEKRSFPYVITNLEEEADVQSLAIDQQEMGRRAAEFMMKCGYQSAWCLLGNRRRFIFQQVAQGFEEIWGRRKLEIVECYGLSENARAAMTSVLNAGPKPDAIFTYGEERTLGALNVLHERNIAVPDEVGVLCYGRTSAVTREAGVTGFADPYIEMGRLAVEVLEKLCTGQPVERKMIVPPPFVLGRTMVF
jgi:DNA-binding LacI/PurR family transcriptional regulator